ncbi:hypothetical protein CEUSTIGMA_g8186.t1 [Chlamydomonas eustigma]|uniref:DNA (cytosine-5-)-methyltransferase n=1 Tax=Chlamydomonas eustigma TaxID=1157962 RepID=A0A250XCF1_9CHLO|nr:hypothetical protein CEUSTIGMA_g8186.t1 [Chlamydomonas eustigma]|eukprot:GAX80751.1 hypothetical protein CEUSTIGMA_g8186.t1 [Chlamydomonas eustigma]
MLHNSKMSVPEVKRRKERDAGDDDEWRWIGLPMSNEERGRRYPSRYVSDVLSKEYVSPNADGLPDHVYNQMWIAHKHFSGVRCKDVGEIHLGDTVAIEGGDIQFFMIVKELFEDLKGKKMFCGHYFYDAVETVMGASVRNEHKEVVGVRVLVPQLKSRLFLAADEDNEKYVTVHALDTINRKVEVKRIKPGEAVPLNMARHTLWYDQIHSRKFFTFRDYYEDGEEPAYKQMENGTVLNVMELCSGAGGTSFLCQKAQMFGKSMELRARWAFDICNDASSAYQVNDPSCHVYVRGIDESLMLSKLYETEVLSKWHPKAVKPLTPADKPSKEVKYIFEVRLGDNAPRGQSGQGKDHLLDHLQRSHCWLEYLVQGYEDDLLRWVKDSEMPACEIEMREFVARERAELQIPVRGDVDMIMGGPPCQGLSGLNRNAARLDILNDPKNRLVCVYYDIVKWFMPKFTLMEQVLDCFKKEDALYARFMASAITAMRYQCRIGIIAAGDHGCAQGRYRVLTWSAQQGMPLPSFPEPSHRCPDFRTPVPEIGKDCLVTFKSIESMQAAYPMNLNGDVLEDLPDISNFCMTDDQVYKCPPTRPWQVYLRRPPLSHDVSLSDRIISADKLMAKSDITYLLELLMLHETEGPAALGRAFFCRKGVSRGESSALSRKLWKMLADDRKEAVAAGFLLDVEEGDEDVIENDVEEESSGNESPAEMSSASDGDESSDEEESTSSSDGDDAEGAIAGLCELSDGREGPSAAVPAKSKKEIGGSRSQSKKAVKALKKTSHSEAGAGDSDREDATPEVDLKKERNFAAQTWAAYLDSLEDPLQRSLAELKKVTQAEAYAAELGAKVYHEVERAIQEMQRGGAAMEEVEGEDLRLRDHRSLQCNADDYERMVAVPSFKGAGFRDMPGVVSNSNGTCCAGHCHAFKSDKKEGPRTGVQKNGCAAGGTIKAPTRSLHRSSRVDNHDKGGWRGIELEGCSAKSFWLPSGDLLCPRWCITYQGGKSGKGGGRQTCFGRVWYDEVQPTVVTRAEPHNLRIVHPVQDRVLSIRENERCQGFPDYWVLVGLSTGQRISSGSVPARYTQIGNAVAPPMARKLGLCILTSLMGPFRAYGTKEDEAIIAVRDPEMDEAYTEAHRRGLKSVSEEDGSDAAALQVRISKAQKEDAKMDLVRKKEAALVALSVGSALTASAAARRRNHDCSAASEFTGGSKEIIVSLQSASLSEAARRLLVLKGSSLHNVEKKGNKKRPIASNSQVEKCEIKKHAGEAATGRTRVVK